jgi:hypothetical protein
LREANTEEVLQIKNENEYDAFADRIVCIDNEKQ